jgi:hypothetical protein
VSKATRNKGQAARFKAVARSLECDESERAFDKALRKLAKPKAKRHRKTL